MKPLNRRFEPLQAPLGNTRRLAGMDATRAFRDALLVAAGEGGVIDSRRLGSWLAANKGRIVGGVRIVELRRSRRSRRSPADAAVGPSARIVAMSIISPTVTRSIPTAADAGQRTSVAL